MEELEIVASKMEITDKVIQEIEEAVGVGIEGWDFADEKEIIRACWVAFAKQVARNTRRYYPKLTGEG